MDAGELFALAGAQDHVGALMAFAEYKRGPACDATCWEEVRRAYRRAGELGEKYGYHHLAAIILDQGQDSELETVERLLALFSGLSKRDDLDSEGNCRGSLRTFATDGHSAEHLYGLLEERLGRDVERVPDRVCP